MKVVLAVDSFKGTLSSEQAENILAKHIRAAGIECVCIPLADGGEGLIDSLSSTLQGEIVRVRVTDPNGEKVTAKYLLRGDTAILETAEAAGLPLSHTPAPDTTTYGVGEMILDAEKRGATRFVLGLGGSATTDGGCGMAAALGANF